VSVPEFTLPPAKCVHRKRTFGCRACIEKDRAAAPEPPRCPSDHRVMALMIIDEMRIGSEVVGLKFKYFCNCGAESEITR
jgi:hypothetical protein